MQNSFHHRSKTKNIIFLTSQNRVKIEEIISVEKTMILFSNQ